MCGPIPRPVSQYLTGQGCVVLYLDLSVSHRAGMCGPIPRPISQYLTGQGCVVLYLDPSVSISQGRAVWAYT